MARKFAAIVFSFICLHASSALALGLGDLTLDSFLNEPLKARVDLLNTGNLVEDQIRVRLASKEDFERMGVDRTYFLTRIAFNVKIDTSGRGSIIITSEDPVLEPYLDFIIEARWPSGRLLREYTVLIDPPLFDQSNPVVSASERVAEVEGIPAPVKKKTEVASSRGTRVGLGRSNLAPGEMPRRGFNASTSPRPRPGSRYMINRDDTLWDIAYEARPGGASVPQTMLDIQQRNPDAFISNNINLIKAGYIISLPREGDLIPIDQQRALAEVARQNQAWRQYELSEPDFSRGPALRISADTDEAVGTGAGGARPVVASGSAIADELAKAELESSELGARLLAMEQQIATLQRIVSLKDDQIAALQKALAGGIAAIDQATQAALDELPVEEAMSEPVGMPADDETGGGRVGATQPAQPVIEQEVDVTESVAQPGESEAGQSGGIMGYLWYLLAAVAAAVGGFFVLRRRRGMGQEEEEGDYVPPMGDAFADVELQDQALEVEDEAGEAADIEAEQERENRGYGQRKHDQYASDVEANDALAEADIYIAYGRYPQAIDLLNNAIGSEPNNPEYRLKLMEMHLEMGDRASAEAQIAELKSINDPGSLARAEELLRGGDEKPDSAGDQEPVAEAGTGEEPAAETDFGEELETLPLESLAEPSPTASLDDSGVQMESLVDSAARMESLSDSAAEMESLADSAETLGADFRELEIEEPDFGASIEEELDLTADFDDDDLAPVSLDEDLVVAAETDGLSTKLDLARAYLDMGDEDGARQILEEVAAEGTEDLQAEARELLEGID